ncbi:hypothetical protein AVEN_103443-1 [Araneus ventricosus]|uniref:Uncharacterized protein n=1 Tax=Araneus ventricosus TaxID=182803 RepID=A0A4Y2SS86_ARAVE|nr:hypothetical protein AVEN_211365-1 [Araneus ventricosus]GBN91229.1 hypothetical protein AVEN_103443-1 [Araneus ventricosus]
MELKINSWERRLLEIIMWKCLLVLPIEFAELLKASLKLLLVLNSPKFLKCLITPWLIYLRRLAHTPISVVSGMRKGVKAYTLSDLRTTQQNVGLLSSTATVFTRLDQMSAFPAGV